MASRASRITASFRRPTRRRLLLALVGVVAVLAAVRIALPFVVQRMINDRLAAIPDYDGRVGGVSLQLWRGAYAIDDLAITKTEGERQTPFFSARRIDFSIAWRDLRRGKLVSDIVVEEGALVFLNAETEQGSQLAADRRWQDVIQDVFPIEITQLVVRGGSVRYIDKTREPHVDFAVKEMQLTAIGLRNRRSETGEDLPADIDLAGVTVGDGRVNLRIRADPLAPQPRFDLGLEVENVSLPALNNVLRAYANVDVSRGTFALFLEIAAQDGAYEGYVKPFFEDLDFENITDRERSLPERLWESVASFLETVLANKQRETLGTRVPFAGRFGDVEVGMWSAIANTVRHGFGQAFSESLEGSITPADVATGEREPGG